MAPPICSETYQPGTNEIVDGGDEQAPDRHKNDPADVSVTEEPPAIQAIAMALGLMIAGVPGAGLLGFLTLIIALSQVGPLLVLVWGGAA